jgi:hypothetical protein
MVESESWLQKPSGKIAASSLCVAAVVLLIWELKASFHGDTPGDPNTTMYVDSETGKAFPHKNVVGESIPVLSPFTDRNTGYPGNPCYWTASGEIRKDPFWLLLNSQLGKAGPTFCPDCGRLFIPRQGVPRPGQKPPPAREELLHDNSPALGQPTR